MAALVYSTSRWITSLVKPVVWLIAKWRWFHAELFLTSSSSRRSTYSSSPSYNLKEGLFLHCFLLRIHLYLVVTCRKRSMLVLSCLCIYKYLSSFALNSLTVLALIIPFSKSFEWNVGECCKGSGRCSDTTNYFLRFRVMFNYCNGFEWFSKRSIGVC